VLALSFVLAGVVKLAGSCLPPLCASGGDSVGCLNAIADPQAMQVMLSPTCRTRVSRRPTRGKSGLPGVVDR
jgi:hypothetical protein